MKVIHANKFHYLQGGTERYYLDTMELLEKEGVDCIPFAMEHEKNLESKYSNYFVSNVDFSKVRFDKEGLRVLGRMLYSFEAKEKIGKLVEDEKPDLVHVHNIYHQISPSILHELKRRKIPVVMTVHDYKIISPDYLLFTEYPKPRYTQDCKKYRYYNAIRTKSIKNSYSASALAAFEMYFHKMLQIYERNVDLFIAPSQFVKDTLIEWGQDGSKIEVLHHYVKYDDYPYSFMYNSQDPYIIYWGRHSSEKGPEYLVAAMEKLPHIKLKMAGTGPQHEYLKQLAQDKGLKNIEFLGFVPDDELSHLARDAQFTVVPSVFPETFGLVITEAFAFGKPVIGPRRGAPIELIEDDKNGYLFDAQNVSDLAKKIDQLWNQKEKIHAMGKYARSQAEKKFAPKKHVEALIDMYSWVMNKDEKIRA